jgi:thioredoxin 2
MPRASSRFARISIGFDEHPSFSLVKNPQNGGPGEVSGLASQFLVMDNTAASNTLHVACTHCSATNRVPVTRLGEQPNCGRCGRPLLQGQVLELCDANFDAAMAATPLAVLVDFWAPWCGPCRMMAPAFEQAAGQLAGRALLVKVNSDENPGLSARFGIRSIPTLVRLQRGQERARQSGAMSAGAIVALATG